MHALHRLVSAVCRGAAWAGCGMLFLAAVLVAIEVVGRKLFDFPFAGATELSSYALAVASSWVFAFALLERAHVRIDSVYRLLPRPWQAALDLLALLAIMVYAGLLAFFVSETFRKSLTLDSHANTPLATPLWLPQGLYLAGLLLLLLVALYLLVAAMEAIRRGDLPALQRLIGSTSLDELVEESRGGALARSEEDSGRSR